jgi:hypothetical protein
MRLKSPISHRWLTMYNIEREPSYQSSSFANACETG